jgi:hypothetical protein
VCELLSFSGHVALLWLVGGRATPRLQVTLGGAAATRLRPTVGVGGAALTLWALHRTGLGARAATRTLLTFVVVLYAVSWAPPPPRARCSRSGSPPATAHSR